MKFVPSRDLRIQPGKVWKDLKKERELIITSHGRPVALMVPVRDDNVEETLRALRAARAAEAVRAVRDEWADRKKPTMPEIDEIIAKSRRRRRGR